MQTLETVETVRAWKDEEYRDTLTQAERQRLPAHPAGVIELDPSRLHGGWLSGQHTVIHNCTNYDSCTLHHSSCH
jgi:mersacidin/lichenicidin family type 2 lantibiotic